MRYSLFALAATAALVSADCLDDYNTCIAAGTPQVKCSCELTTCSGEDAARLREFCATATANLSSGTFTTLGSATSSPASTITGTAGSQPSGQAPITAAENSIPLGGKCSDDAQCAGDAQCYGTTAFTIRTCGSFNSGCKADTDCATNTCENGICSGFLPSASYLANSASATSSSAVSSTASSLSSVASSLSSAASSVSSAASSVVSSATSTVAVAPTQSSATSITTSIVTPTSSAAASGPETSTSVVVVPGSQTTGAPTSETSAAATSEPLPYSGAASNVGYGFAAVVFGVFACAL